MSDNDTSGGTEPDPGTVETRLEAVEQYIEHLRETTPYYEWLGPELEAVDRGYVRVRQPHIERVKPPAIGPDTGINGGVLMTVIDAAGMAAIVAERLEPTPLATTQVDVTFHDGADEDHVLVAETIDVGSTLATARVTVLPASEADEPDPDPVATGRTTARLFE